MPVKVPCIDVDLHGFFNRSIELKYELNCHAVLTKIFHLDVLERVSFIGRGISSILNSRGIYSPEEVKVSVDLVF